MAEAEEIELSAQGLEREGDSPPGRRGLRPVQAVGGRSGLFLR